MKDEADLRELQRRGYAWAKNEAVLRSYLASLGEDFQPGDDGVLDAVLSGIWAAIVSLPEDELSDVSLSCAGSDPLEAVYDAAFEIGCEAGKRMGAEDSYVDAHRAWHEIPWADGEDDYQKGIYHHCPFCWPAF